MGKIPDRPKRLGRHWRTSHGYHIDVSDLSPPEPMVAILQLIEQPGFTGPVIVHHNREPVHLYPELVERGWDFEVISEIGEQNTGREIRLLLTKLK
jgi:hypothetical protein